MITEKDFWMWVDHEIDWLYYYSWYESRSALNENSEIYKDLLPLGYVKRQMPLDLRCAKCFLTSDKIIEPGTKIEDLYHISYPRKDNVMTPLEIAIKIFPERKMEFLNRLKPTPHVAEVFYDKKMVR
jgi:hypothetical protein